MKRVPPYDHRCGRCGEMHVVTGTGGFSRAWCDPCRNRYMAQYRAEHKELAAAKQQHAQEMRDRIRALARALGCSKCGTTTGPLHYHHRNAATKNQDVASMSNHSWSTIKQEIDLCDVLCQHCHEETHHPGCHATHKIKLKTKIRSAAFLEAC